jgi:hypothetical protein
MRLKSREGPTYLVRAAAVVLISSGGSESRVTMEVNEGGGRVAASWMRARVRPEEPGATPSTAASGQGHAVADGNGEVSEESMRPSFLIGPQAQVCGARTGRTPAQYNYRILKHMQDFVA